MDSTNGASAPTRRRFGRNILAGGVATIFMPAIIARASDTLTVNSQGGEYQELFERTVIRPFEQKFGVKVTHDPTGLPSQDYAKI